MLGIEIIQIMARRATVVQNILTKNQKRHCHNGNTITRNIDVLTRQLFKGVGMPWPKKKFFEFIVRLDRVAQEKLFGVGMTLPQPRVCPLETV